MTRGELEKEAEEYAIGLFPNDVFRQSAVIQGIIKFTEPREKRIAELEQENNKLLDVINNQDVKIADLEKENAELKEELKDANEKVVHLACNQNKDLKNKLTKAKDILRMIVYWKSDKKELLNFINKAEKLLKEIEK